MKNRSIFIVSIVSLLLVLSCSKIEFSPIETSAIDIANNNSSSPYNKLYQEILDEYVAMGLPGVSVAIETPDYGWWIGASGMASVEEEITMEPYHLHQSASLCKTYTATLILRLVEEGKLSLDDPIKNYLPADLVSQISNAESATVSQLLNHTSGIVNSDDNLKMYVDILNYQKEELTTDNVLEQYVFGVPAHCKPGEEFHYTNTGYTLLGMIIEQVSEMELGEYFIQEIREPLGLTNTYFKSDPGYPGDLPNRVNAYWERIPDQLQNCTDINDLLLGVSVGYEGVYACPYDFARFIQNLIRGNILEPSTVETMLSEEYSGDPPWSSGYYLGLERYYGDTWEAFGHEGSSVGTKTMTLYFPDDDVTFSMATNLGGIFYGPTTRKFHLLINELLNVTFTGERGTDIKRQ